jgi:hypothetical protein
MSEVKTKVNNSCVTDFLSTLPDDKKRNDSLMLLDIFTKVTGEKPKMWGSSIIGFGMYHYKSERSTQEGDWPLSAFSPRKQNLTLYVMSGIDESSELLRDLGKHKRRGGCLYLNKLDDVNLSVLEKIIYTSFEHMKKIHGTV